MYDEKIHEEFVNELKKLRRILEVMINLIKKNLN